MFHDLMVEWFEWTHRFGYAGIFALMAIESTVVPIPSEIVIPPAAWYAQQGELNVWGVVAAGGLGSTFGSSLCYWACRTAGRAFVARWGRWFLLPQARLDLAERWLSDFALPGVFFARLLPVVRHLIGFPAGLLRIPFLPFAGVTLFGSTLWCSVLAWFGARTIGRHPDLLDDPEVLAVALKQDMAWFIVLAVAVFAGWLFVHWYQRRVRA